MGDDVAPRWSGDPQLPVVHAAACVHTRLPRASCRVCVEACPNAAWGIDDEQLAIDAGRCDGCGLCAAACPQGAIQGHLRPLLLSAGEHLLAFARCDQTPAHESRDGLMACLHAIGMVDLLQGWQSGLRRLLVAGGDCEHCQRAGGERLEARLERVNRLLTARQAAPIGYQRLQPDAWWRELRQARSRQLSRPLDRRGFLRRALQAPIQRARQGGQAGDQAFQPPGTLLPDSIDAPALFAFAPAIDPGRCSGCDACVRLCPQGALQLDDARPCYRIDAARCTHCGICGDVCEQQAVEVVPMSACPRPRVPLYRGHCRVCGVAFHATRRAATRCCPICRRGGRHGGLFQVLG